jgi:hypothetical protein
MNYAVMRPYSLYERWRELPPLLRRASRRQQWPFCKADYQLKFSVRQDTMDPLISVAVPEHTTLAVPPAGALG